VQLHLLKAATESETTPLSQPSSASCRRAVSAFTAGAAVRSAGGTPCRSGDVLLAGEFAEAARVDQLWIEPHG